MHLGFKSQTFISFVALASASSLAFTLCTSALFPLQDKGWLLIYFKWLYLVWEILFHVPICFLPSMISFAPDAAEQSLPVSP